MQSNTSRNATWRVLATLILAWAKCPLIPAAVFLGYLGFQVSTTVNASEPFSLKTGDVVVFAGGANMLHLQQAAYLETALTNKFASAHVRFRDWSWEADTVFRQGSVIERWRKNGFGSRDEQLKRLGATVVVAQFGQLESLAGKNSIDDFSKAYNILIDAFLKQAKLVVLVTPTLFEKPSASTMPDLSNRNADLALYVEAIKTIATDRELKLVDLFQLSHTSKTKLTDNGMHITAGAQRVVSQLIETELGIEATPNDKLEPLRQAVIEKHRLWYDYWRPANWKLLYGDDARRQFTRGGKDYIPFKDEWKMLVPLIAKAEHRIWRIAAGEKDSGSSRPSPEKLHGDSKADIEKELASFTVPEGFEVNLFASEKHGLTSPLAVRWDTAGRMYVTITTTYPHVYPGDLPNDKILTLEDSNGDGHADKSVVFAEGLNIPTGMELGDGGVYVGQNTELLFLKDTNGDGKADQRRVLLGGLGNGDSHQTCNAFVWSPSGELFFGQGDGIESRVETPWGSSDLFQSGFYRFRPRRMQLHGLLDDFMGPGNPWGVAFDEWGQIFSIDGAGGVTYLSPGQVPVSHKLRLRTIGNPGGYCGIDILSGDHLPTSMRGDFVVGDFKANQVKRFKVIPEGAGFALKWQPHFLKSKHRNFRPVDVKMGPDGAIYVVDWYNPITCHQDDAYRDPTRDKAHGRIWRVSLKEAGKITNKASHRIAASQQGNLSKLSIAKVLEALKSSMQSVRYQAKRELTRRDAKAVAKGLDQWVAGLDTNDARYEHHLFEAIGAYATVEVVAPQLLQTLLQARDYRARAYAARMVGRWHDRLPDALALLTPRVTDKHPQVRMEAVIACGAIADAQAMVVAARAVDLPMDRWLDYAFTQVCHKLKPVWSPAFHRDEITFETASHLATVMSKTGGKDVLRTLMKLADSKEITANGRMAAVQAILTVGGPRELRMYGLERKRFMIADEYQPAAHAKALATLVQVSQLRDLQPDDEVSVALNALIDQNHAQVKHQGLVLAGLWKVHKSLDKVLAAAKNESLAVKHRIAAFIALARLQGITSKPFLLSITSDSTASASLRAGAIEALVILDESEASNHAVRLLRETDLDSSSVEQLMHAFLNRKTGGKTLAKAFGQWQQQHKGKPMAFTSARGERLLRQYYATGRSDTALDSVLNNLIGVSGQAPGFSETYVNELVQNAMQQGNATRGALLVQTAGCVACHQFGKKNGDRSVVIGPDLTAIGTTLSPSRIVEEVLWPGRQVKEGYSAVQVFTNDGEMKQGYLRSSKASQKSGDLVLRELKSEKIITIKKQSIDERRVTGSPMPTGLTSKLTRPELLDLLRYLIDQGKNK